jgi:hypothetical protein
MREQQARPVTRLAQAYVAAREKSLRAALGWLARRLLYAAPRSIRHVNARSARSRSRLRARTPIACCALALLWLTGCGDDGATPQAELELGSGEASFEPASNGSEQRLYAGTQGGHHVWLSMRVRGLDGENLQFTLDVVPSAPAPPAHTEASIRFTRATSLGEGWYEFTGWPARVLMPECAVGQPVQLSVTLRDAAGRTVQGDLEVIAGAPLHDFAVPCVP